MSKILKRTGAVCLSLSLFGYLGIAESSFGATPSQRTFICKKDSGAINLREGKCKKGETKVNNIALLTGADGVDGADGSIRIFGDGSEGAVTVSTSSQLASVGSNHSHQFSNLTIDSGVTLFVPSGTVLRVAGSFTNNGTIFVYTYASGAYYLDFSSSIPPFSPAGSGVAKSGGGQGQLGTGNLTGGRGADSGNTNNESANFLHTGVLGGSGGGAGGLFGGGAGGGTLTVLASGAIINNGTISAEGDDAAVGGGGGGGGIVILASKTSVTNGASGVISVAGGRGGVSNNTSAAGGGGGGGLVRLISVTAPVNSGTITVSGGLKGSNALGVTDSTRTAGAGGGACAGSGGNGSSIIADSSVSNQDGSAGISILTTADPTSLF